MRKNPSPYRWCRSSRGDTYEHGPMCSRIHALWAAWIATSVCQPLRACGNKTAVLSYFPISDRILFCAQVASAKKYAEPRNKIARKEGLQQASCPPPLGALSEKRGSCKGLHPGSQGAKWCKLREDRR